MEVFLLTKYKESHPLTNNLLHNYGLALNQEFLELYSLGFRILFFSFLHQKVPLLLSQNHQPLVTFDH